MNARLEAELTLLRQHYHNVDYLVASGVHWFRVEKLKTPKGWSPDEIPVVFSVTQGHPGAEPYGFFVPTELNLHGDPPSEHPTPHPPPFDGAWRFLSWQPKGWFATADVVSGSNLWGWVRTFMHRLNEGV